MPDYCFDVFPSPATSIISRRKINSLVKSLNPELVYTNAGPAYVQFDCLHIMGCSNPYILNANRMAKNYKVSFLNKLKRELHTLYQRYYIKKADFWILQTDQSKDDFVNIIKCPSDKTFVVYNAISKKFLDYFHFDVINNRSGFGDKIEILYPSAFYPHKNFEIIPPLALKLKENGYNVKFNLTISESSDLERLLFQSEKLGVLDSIFNKGPFEHDKALDIYLSVDIIFQPSLLEVFSTSYIEAIAVRKPLIVSDFAFSRDICKEHAFYFKPGNVDSAYEEIINVINNNIVSNGDPKYLLEKYGDQKQRFNKIYNILSKISGDCYV